MLDESNKQLLFEDKTVVCQQHHQHQAMLVTLTALVEYLPPIHPSISATLKFELRLVEDSGYQAITWCFKVGEI